MEMLFKRKSPIARKSYKKILFTNREFQMDSLKNYKNRLISEINKNLQTIKFSTSRLNNVYLNTQMTRLMIINQIQRIAHPHLLVLTQSLKNVRMMKI